MSQLSSWQATLEIWQRRIDGLATLNDQVETRDPEPTNQRMWQPVAPPGSPLHTSRAPRHTAANTRGVSVEQQGRQEIREGQQTEPASDDVDSVVPLTTVTFGDDTSISSSPSGADDDRLVPMRAHSPFSDLQPHALPKRVAPLEGGTELPGTMP